MSGSSDTSQRPGAAVFNSVMSFLTSQMNRCIDGWRAGNRDAGDELVNRTKTRFYQLAHRMYRRFPNVRPVGEVDDVVNNGWLRLLHTLKSIRPSDTKQFFLLAGVHIHRELLDMARKAKTPKFQTRSLEHAGAGGGSSSGYQVAEPADEMDDIEMWERFHEGVLRLEPRLREVVTLRFYDGRKFTEIATVLGKDERTIRRWWEEACTQIRAYVIGGADAAG